LIEIIISGLLAPVMMWKQTVAIIQIFLGKDAGWSAQQREGSRMPFKVTLRRYFSPTVLGLLLAMAAYAVSIPLFWWMSPVILGLLLTIPLATVTASGVLGRAAGRLGLLVIPEERTPPSIISRFSELASGANSLEGTYRLWRNLLTDPQFSTAHREMLPEPAQIRRGRVNAELVVGLAKLDQCTTIDEALEILTGSEKSALLGDRTAFDRLKALSQSGDA